MKVKYVGYDGYMEYPCYEDENGKLYFDGNNGKNGLCLYTGAYRDSFGEICGEPNTLVTEPVDCDEPFIRHPREFDYMMLSRLKADCNYVLGNGTEKNLYYKDINIHCDEMVKLYESFSDEDKPEWLTLEQIEQYRRDMITKLYK